MGITKVSWSEVDYSLIISASIKWVKGIYIWKLLLSAVNESQRDVTVCIVQSHFVQYMEWNVLLLLYTMYSYIKSRVRFS